MVLRRLHQPNLTALRCFSIIRKSKPAQSQQRYKVNPDSSYLWESRLRKMLAVIAICFLPVIQTNAGENYDGFDTKLPNKSLFSERLLLHPVSRRPAQDICYAQNSCGKSCECSVAGGCVCDAHKHCVPRSSNPDDCTE